MRSRILLGGVLAVGLAYVGCGEQSGGNGGGGGALSAPSNLTGSPMGSGIHLTWTDTSTSEEGFDIERSTATSSFAKITSVAFDTTQYHDTGGLTGGVSYTYRVRASGGGSFSPYSNSVSAVAPGGSGGGSGGGTGGGSGGGVGGGSGGGTGGGAGGGTGFDGLPDGGYSFQTHIKPIFVQSCGSGNNSCHSKMAYGPTTPECRGWLALSDEALGSKNPATNANTGCPDLTLYQRLMQLDAWMCDNPRRKYVVPNDTAGSQLYQVIDPAADPSRGGQCMVTTTVPLGRMPKAPYVISAGDINKIKVWIQQGAPNN